MKKLLSLSSPIASILETLPQPTIKQVAKKFLLYSAVGSILLFLMFSIIIHTDQHKARAITETNEVSKINLLKFVINHDLNMLASDLFILASNESLQSFIDNPSPRHLHRLTRRLLVFAQDRQIYTQVRILNDLGQEIVRIDTKDQSAQVTPHQDLQNKNERYYFKETIQLNKDDIFISPLDLNVENGKTEVPFVPVLRVGTPIFDSAGQKKGIILVNLQAQNILDRFSQAFQNEPSARFHFLNKNGYWLQNDDPAKEWGFMLNKDTVLQKEKPQLWQSIQKIPSGQILVDDGLFTYTTIYPTEEIKNSRSSKPHETDSALTENMPTQALAWHLIIHVPADHFSIWFYLQKHEYLKWLFPIIGIFFLGGTTHLAIVRASKETATKTLKLLSTGIEQSPAAIVITDMDGNIEYANPKFETLTGYKRSSILGEHTRIFKSGKTEDSVYQNLWESVLAGQVWSGDFENKRKDDTPYFVSAKIAPLMTKDKKIEKLMAIQEDVTENKRLQDELKKLATTDDLTQTNNRGQFMNLFAKESLRSMRYKEPLCVLVFDLDHFKNVNDTYGHHTGDVVLKSFCQVISNNLRGSDFLGRLGGEEFAAVLVQTSSDGSQLLAERLRQATENMVVPCDGNNIKITVSIGFTIWKSEDSNVEDVLKRADTALYLAKNNGRNQIQFQG